MHTSKRCLSWQCRERIGWIWIGLEAKGPITRLTETRFGKKIEREQNLPPQSMPLGIKIILSWLFLRKQKKWEQL